MSGHRPFHELTRDFTPEQRRRIDAITRELRADLARREQAQDREERTPQG